MFQSKDSQFNAVKDFHAKMDGRTQEFPLAYEPQSALYRADFKLEEIVEFLYATARNNEEFDEMTQKLHRALDKAAKKSKQNERTADPLLGQVDALLDLLYFTYGSFVLMGVDPEPIFDIVHQANMGKIFPDGKAHFDPITHKILKPENWAEKYAPEPAIQEELVRQSKVHQR
ncbi:HAD family hydrolase [Streptococcus sp. zg-86]|uniref:HAD family hydrolase n=1 Tax=Streptococcus zhangguiae TaxID=2664091 RepID=A0A6I4RIE5_9STRE|nr:HAD family hydrolase [Streptococcus sp. zg-86]MTB90734.1 HAD family hydrolase [Streptococcus sp. zg-36]MWV56271.1 HAD family hydrolase [Streptococcus sp. zg-70]